MEFAECPSFTDDVAGRIFGDENVALYFSAEAGKADSAFYGAIMLVSKNR